MSERRPDAEGIPELDGFDYALPDTAIAQAPLPERDAARLLRVARAGGALIEPDVDRRVLDLPDLLAPGDLLVVNTTKVVPARLRGRKSSGGRVEALLLEHLHDRPEPQSFRALVGSTGRLRRGLELCFEAGGERQNAALVELLGGGEAVLVFEGEQSPYRLGEAPLPPYIKRRDEGERSEAQRAFDLERYQTLYASAPGAVAAPTAGLHLSARVLEALERRGIERAEVVLHVGPGTFRPLRAEDLARGELHAERYVLPGATAEAIARTRARRGRVIAIGTTSTRVLESCADQAAGGGLVRPGSGQTRIFLKPGSPIRVIDGLLTNFHLPRSSLMLLVAALIGREPLLAAYRHALARGYRFYSYGDAMLIL